MIMGGGITSEIFVKMEKTWAEKYKPEI